MAFGPTGLREMFEMFRFYRPEVGLKALLEDADVAHMSPRQMYHAVHNRPPDKIDGGLKPGSYRPIETFIAALSSIEFQENLAAHLLHAFPEKRRLFFVHIPKTAGVDLATHLISRFPSITTTLLDRTLTPDPKLLILAIKHIVLEMGCSDTVFISGHTPLGKYQTWNGNGIRYKDDVFTVVREPLEQILSQINYTLGRIFSDEDPIPPDTAGWRQLFHVEHPDPEMNRGELVRLAQQILHQPGVVVPNVICTFLGGGSCDKSVVQTVAHDLEVVELRQLDTWSQQKWNITHKSKRNSSKKLVSFEDFTSDDMDYARDIVQEDMRYYRLVLDACERRGETSIRGNQIIA